MKIRTALYSSLILNILCLGEACFLGKESGYEDSKKTDVGD